MSLLRKVVIIISAVLMVMLGACAPRETPEPERCSLCGYIPSHAPCLVNLSTGEVGEIALYEPHYSLVGEIAETQRGGYFSFFSAAGLQGYLDACIPEAHIYAPIQAAEYDEQYFCSSCRILLEDRTEDGYVLADLKKPDTPTVYPVHDGSSFTVRCYTVTVTENDDNELDITVIGSIPTDG